MWVEIDQDIFQSSEFKGLNYLYQILSWSPSGSIPRYNVFVDLEKVKNTENYKKLKGVEVKFDEYLTSKFDEFVTSKPKTAKRDYVVTTQKNKKHFNIEEAIRFFTQPISIILENSKNDSCFIVAIINHFEEDNIAKEHLQNGWINFENIGGCTNTENFMDSFLSVFEDLAAKNNRELSDYFRGLIILDSDKEYPSQPPKHTKLIYSLNEKGISHIHILEKRMMENYMPDEVFDELKTLYAKKDRYRDLVAWINVYQHLTNEQKDYLKYYDGFNGDQSTLDSNVRAVYASLSTTNFGILQNGFKYEGGDFKNQFPLLFIEPKKETTEIYDKTGRKIVYENFTNKIVNKTTLSKRCASNELQVIFDKIKELL